MKEFNEDEFKMFFDEFKKSIDVVDKKFPKYNLALEKLAELRILLVERHNSIENAKDYRDFVVIILGILQTILSCVNSYDMRMEILKNLTETQLLLFQKELLFDKYHDKALEKLKEERNRWKGEEK